MKLTKEKVLKLFPSNIIVSKNDSESEYYFLNCTGNNGKFFFKIYQYADDENTIYISDLFIDEDIRKLGIGTKIFEIVFKICKVLNTDLLLFVNKDFWMYEWYQRLGFQYLDEKEDAENHVWMVKYLQNNYDNVFNN